MGRLLFSISGLVIQVEADMDWTVPPEFQDFLTDRGEPDHRALFRPVDTLPEVSDRVCHTDRCYRVHPDGRGGCVRSFFDAPRSTVPYALEESCQDAGRTDIFYLPGESGCLSQFNSAFFHIGLESVLLHRQRLILHGACVDTAYGGLIFSGPSGIGKSTQAALWKTHRQAEEINGDRPILQKTDRGWIAWGSPYAGSSRCHINKSCPVRAIVMLRQEKFCAIRRLGPGEAFRAIWFGLTVRSYDRRETELATELAMDLAGEVPVYELCCTPDADAVVCLEQALRKDE